MAPCYGTATRVRPAARFASTRGVSREPWHPAQQGHWLDDGRYELKLPFTDETELLMAVLRQGGQVEVLSPATLRTLVGQRLREALQVYAC